MTSIGGAAGLDGCDWWVGEPLGWGGGGESGDPGAAPGTATKKVTASRWPWKLSCACAIEHCGILPPLKDPARTNVAWPVNYLYTHFIYINLYDTEKIS